MIYSKFVTEITILNKKFKQLNMKTELPSKVIKFMKNHSLISFDTGKLYRLNKGLYFGILDSRNVIAHLESTIELIPDSLKGLI